MARTQRMNWPFPNEDADPWFEAFRNFVNAVDASFFVTREDKSFILFGGGTVTFDATSGDLTWGSVLEAVSATSGLRWFIPSSGSGDTVTLQDGEFLFVELTRNPQTPQSIAPKVGSKINPNDNAIVLAQRIGSAVIWRNGAVISSGQSIILFGPRVFTQVAEVVGVAGLQETDEVTFIGIGGFQFDPADYFGGGVGVTREIRFQALLETTDDATPLPAEVKLRNLTDGGDVSNSTLSSSSLTPELVSSSILSVGSGGDLPNAVKDYEVQLRLDDTSGSPTPSDRVACKMAKLRINWT